jgi:hypothetical protein
MLCKSCHAAASLAHEEMLIFYPCRFLMTSVLVVFLYPGEPSQMAAGKASSQLRDLIISLSNPTFSGLILHHNIINTHPLADANDADSIALEYLSLPLVNAGDDNVCAFQGL